MIHSDGRYETPSEILDRNFSQFASLTKTVKLSDVITVNADPFYVEVVNPKDKT
jgi:hypothetical protein